MPHFTHSVASIIIGLAGTGSAAFSGDISSRNQQPASKGTKTSTVSFADELLRIDQLGFTMRIPVGAVSKASAVGERKTIQIVPGDSDALVNEKAWLINVSTPMTSNPKTSIADSINQFVALLEAKHGTKSAAGAVVHTEAVVVERTEKLLINGQAAGRVYMRVPGQNNSSIIKGYTIFNPASKQFVILELVTPSAAFDRVRGTYETIVATATFKASKEVERERELAVATASRLFERLTPADYLEAMRANEARAEETWQRLYVPAPSGDDTDAKELGYRGLKFWRGQRGEINPDLPKSQWGDTEKQEGYLARLAVRLIDESAVGVQVGKNAPASVFIDSIGMYFMSEDRKEEAWTVRLVKRDAAGNELARWTESAARIGNQVSLAVGDPKQRSRPIIAEFGSQGYICQFETFLLPTLLVKHAVNSKQTEFESGTYSYRTDGESVAFRRDIVSRDSDGTGWTIVTRVRDEPVSQTYIFDSRGNHVRTELTEGRVWEPIEIDRLFALWREKRLPTETTGGTARKR